MIRPDCVHLTDKGIRQVISATQKCVHLFKAVPSAQKPTLGDPIPCGTLFSSWIESYREVCGFESFKPYSSRQRTASGSGLTYLLVYLKRNF